jgi:hypothetical protein
MGTRWIGRTMASASAVGVAADGFGSHVADAWLRAMLSPQCTLAARAAQRSAARTDHSGRDQTVLGGSVGVSYPLIAGKAEATGTQIPLVAVLVRRCVLHNV